MTMKRVLPVLIVLAMVAIEGCGESEPARPVTGTAPEPVAKLRPQVDLESHCYRWPEATFTRFRYADTVISLASGDRAIEFSLESTAGEQLVLSELLKTRPVALILGSFT